ncbi:MAG: hypothetical protein HZA93_24105 [Verrucomicrobia bacterium]|nr:hypothetical protein [Verrucomicrobiota bacterium]
MNPDLFDLHLRLANDACRFAEHGLALGSLPAAIGWVRAARTNTRHAEALVRRCTFCGFVGASGPCGHPQCPQPRNKK